MTAAALLQLAAERGIVLEPAPGGRLRFRAPAHALTPELREALLAHKAKLLRLLADLPARVRAIEERTLEAIAAGSPPGLGRWDGAWERVEPASALYLAALAELERTGTPQAERAAKEAANELVRAWRRAAVAWEAAGRSVTWPAEAEGEAP